ncbi:hypothetical protein BDW71DRAFT_204884 [Aspergillus fruticulosus]
MRSYGAIAALLLFIEWHPRAINSQEEFLGDYGEPDLFEPLATERASRGRVLDDFAEDRDFTGSGEWSSITTGTRSSELYTARQGYNDIASWNQQLLLSVFGLKDGELHSRRAETKSAFEEIIGPPEYTDLNSIQLLEAMMDKMDVPWRLQAQIDLINERNRLLGEKNSQNGK